jgi:hypothetical protein
MNEKLGLELIITMALVTTYGASLISQPQPVGAFINSDAEPRKAPPAITGDDVYVVWWTNKTGNEEVMFRTSSDGGKTFGDTINLSNTTDSDSQDAEIAADGMNVVVTWWERNQTSNEPVLKISTNGGKTFGALIKLANNGTIGTGELRPLF